MTYATSSLDAPIAVGSPDWRERRYHDRAAAGRVLAVHLLAYKGRTDVIVLALPRGGVPVARIIADALGAPLDVFVVRKLGVPGHEEFAFGAVAAGGTVVVDRAIIQSLGLTPAVIADVLADEQRELDRREHAYRDDAPPPAISGKTVILVDDGLATGATMHAAIAALRAFAPTRIVVAVPVGSPEVLDALRAVADEVVCPLPADPLWAVGAWYEHFADVPDDAVRAALGGRP